MTDLRRSGQVDATVAGARGARLREAASIVRQLLNTLGPFLSVGALLLTWEVIAQLELVMPFLLPKLSVVLMRIVADLFSGELLVNVWITLYRTMIAFGIAAGVGVSLGILISRVGVVRWFFDPLISIGLPMPKLALIPVFMLWFGLYDMSKILMVAFSASFQIIITTWAGTQSVDQQLVWSARSLGASDRRILWEVILPGALPQILTGLQIAMPICLIVVLVTEMVMGGLGLGDAMLRAARYADSPGVFAGIVEIGLVGFVVIKTMALIRRRLLSWHQETARDAGG